MFGSGGVPMADTALAYGRDGVPVDAEGKALWLDVARLPEATGWELKPEGMCRDEVCVPIPPARRSDFVEGGRFNLRAFAQHLGQPVVHEPEAGAWVIGEAPTERASRLQGEAPDFELPDLSGARCRLSDHRGGRCCW
jgi:hypothetical protein